MDFHSSHPWNDTNLHDKRISGLCVISIILNAAVFWSIISHHKEVPSVAHSMLYWTVRFRYNTVNFRQILPEDTPLIAFMFQSIKIQEKHASRKRLKLLSIKKSMYASWNIHNSVQYLPESWHVVICRWLWHVRKGQVLNVWNIVTK